MSRLESLICIILILHVLFTYPAQAQIDQQITFTKIETNQGISDDYFNWVLQDSKGFMWFGSIYNGLYRYDGYNFKVYRPEPGNPKSISNVGIEVIYEHPADSGKVLWIGTRSGTLIDYQFVSDQFSSSEDYKKFVVKYKMETELQIQEALKLYNLDK